MIAVIPEEAGIQKCEPFFVTLHNTSWIRDNPSDRSTLRRLLKFSMAMRSTMFNSQHGTTGTRGPFQTWERGRLARNGLKARRKAKRLA